MNAKVTPNFYIVGIRYGKETRANIVQDAASKFVIAFEFDDINPILHVPYFDELIFRRGNDKFVILGQI